MAVSARKFQAPRGTRDFYPADMAVRRYIEGVWREVSINHGFEEVEGPVFEDLELYTHKSGPGIVSEIFQVFSGKDEQQRAAIAAGADAPYALRPEFTPTLARMVAAQAAQLPKPIKWFAIPSHFRAERPQRGRLREFMQWNVDFIGGEVDSARADAEVIAVAAAALGKLGLAHDSLSVRVSSRETMANMLRHDGIADDLHERAFALLDRYGSIPQRDFAEEARQSGLDPVRLQTFAQTTVSACGTEVHETTLNELLRLENYPRSELGGLFDLEAQLKMTGVSEWCRFDLSIVRGLAYYTGTVFEIIAEGERAIAGGGRYDNLIESFGGPSMPACGFGMGDVVLGILLKEKNLLPEEIVMAPLRPHVFVISSGDEPPEQDLPKLVAHLRRAGYHVRHTYRSTRNVGKLLGEAGKARARCAIILDQKLAEGLVSIKDLESGEQRDDVPRDGIESAIRAILAKQHENESPSHRGKGRVGRSGDR